MEIEFRSANLKRDCEDIARARRRWGADAGKTIVLRLVQVAAADCLEDLSHEPPIRRHRLTGRREGQYAVSVDGRLRIILQPLSPGGTPDMTSHPAEIRRVKIMEVTDYHD